MHPMQFRSGHRQEAPEQAEIGGAPRDASDAFRSGHRPDAPRQRLEVHAMAQLVEEIGGH